MNKNIPRVAVKITTIGNYNVGKTTLVERYVKNSVSLNNGPTLAAAYTSTNVSVGNEKVKVDIWDTAGTEKFNALMPIYLRGSDIVLLCFNAPVIEDIEKRIKMIKDVVSAATIVLVRTKIDQAFSFNLDEKSCSLRSLDEFATENNLSLYHTSALTGEGVNQLFQECIKPCFESKKAALPKEDDSDSDDDLIIAAGSCCILA